MRQSLGDYDAISENIDYALNMDYAESLRKCRERIRLSNEKHGSIDFSSMLDQYALLTIEMIAFAYTRGDAVQQIDETLMQPAIPRVLDACNEIDALELAGKQYFWGSNAGGAGKPYTYHMRPSYTLDVLVFMAYSFSFKVDKNALKKIVPYLAPVGESRIVDAVLSHLDGTHKVANAEAYESSDMEVALYEIYAAPDTEKPQLIDAYLSNWLKLMCFERYGTALSTLGHYMSHKHKTPKTLSKDTAGKYPLYRGHWAWEIVCLVKLQGIDDTSFRHSEWYPADLVDYKS